MAGYEQVLNPHSQPYALPMDKTLEQFVLTDQVTSQYSGDCTDLIPQKCNTAEYQESGTSLRRKRTIFTKLQLKVLELHFQANQYPNFDHREQLSKYLAIPEPRIHVWFQNRRSKERRQSVSPNKPPVVLMEYFSDDKTEVKRVLRQQKMVASVKLVKTQKDYETNFLPQAPSRGYHPYAYPLPLAQHASGEVHFQNVSYETNLVVQQQAYSNMAPVTSNGAMDLTKEFSLRSNIFNQFPSNTTRSEMSVGTPVFPVTTNLNPCSTPIPYQVPIAYGNLNNQLSTSSDSGLSDHSVDSYWEGPSLVKLNPCYNLSVGI